MDEKSDSFQKKMGEPTVGSSGSMHHYYDRLLLFAYYLPPLFCLCPIYPNIQLGQLRLNPPGLGSKCGKRVERLSDF